MVLALSVSPSEAQTVPTGYQEYFVIGRDQHIWDMMDKVQDGEGGAQFVDGMNSVVTATASAENQIFYYDHWEDGLEADILNPVQGSTLVIGDGNPANGDACDFNNSPCGVDVLAQGDFVNFASDQGLAAGCALPSAQPATYTELCSSVPMNPRCAVAGACTSAEVHFDGGDYIYTSGGPASIVHSQYPLTQFIGGSTEMLSRQAVEAARSYSVPVGEDLYPAFGCPNCVMEPFHYVDLNLVAFEDNTQVVVTSPGAGTATFTLNRGQHWSSLGLIDDTIAAPSLTINAGTKVSTTGPINGMIFTGGDGTWATRHYALLPDLLHSTDYVITAPGDDPAGGPAAPTNRPANIYILNPDPLNAITVTTTDSLGSSTINIPPNSVVDYFSGTGRFVPNGSTVRLTSDRNFWGISAYDYNTNISDWGHSWLATKFLSRNYTISYAPASVPPPTANLNPVYVAATQDNTRVQFDLDNDGIFDAVDLDGDGAADAAPLPNNAYLVSALGALRAFDPNPLDRDNTGTRIVSNKPVAVAWGQDTDLTQFGDAALDTGYTAYPTNQLFLDPVLVIDKEVDRTTVPTAGGIATYTLTVTSYDFGPLTNLRVFDLLDPAVPGGSYVPGSTLVTYPNLVQDTADPTITINAGAPDQLEWTVSPDTLGTNQTLTIRYSVNIPAAPGGTPRLLTNEGHAEARLGGSTFSPFDTADLVQTDIDLTKSVDSVNPGAGDVLTFTLNVVNGGAVAETGVIISDPIPANTTFVPGSITGAGPFALPPAAFDPAQNAVVWRAANFPVGGPHALTFQARVNPGVPAGTSIENRGGYESNETPYFLSNEVTPVVTGPLLQATKTGPAPPLHPGQTATFEILVENLGAAPATSVRIVDLFPSNATYTPESMEWRLNTGSFTPVTDAALDDEGTLYANRLELVVGTLGAGEDLIFRFSVVVDAGTAWGSVNNQATVTSAELVSFDTNLVSIPIVGDAGLSGRVFLDLDGNGAQDPGEPGIANTDVVVTDATGVSQVVTTDPNGDYACTVDVGCYRDILTTFAYDGSDGTLDWSANPWIEFRAGVPDQDPTAGSLSVVPDPLGVNGFSLVITGNGQTPKGFDRAAVMGGATSATLAFDYRRAAFEAVDQVTVFASYDGAPFVPLGTYGGAGTDAAWQSVTLPLNPGAATANVVIRFGTTGGFGGTDFFYIDNVRLCPSTAAIVDVDETDPDFPVGATLTTGNEPQSVLAASGGTAAATPIGYELPPLTVDKRSSAAGSNVVPGETITYTIEITNNTGMTQTGLDVTDPLPTGTSYVSGSAQVSSPVFRVSEYYVSPGTFTGLTYDLPLSQDLAADYFVIVQGSDGTTADTGGRSPASNYARLTRDPLGTGDLAASGATNQIRIERGASVAGTSWVGVVTVVECVADCDAAGFRLRSVEDVLHNGTAVAGSDTSATAWTAIGQVQLVGGFNGAGCSTGDANVEDQKVCHARIYPSGTDTINWTRDAGGATSLSDARSTVMVVEWGSEWTVQRARVQGGNGGDGLNAAGEYNTAALGSAVVRDNTWVWGTGHTNDQGIGDAGEGVALTLGNGVVQNPSESSVAAGIEYAGNAVDFEVYALTHADLATDYRFKADGDSGALIVNVAVDAAAAGQRMALVTNGQNGTGNAYPRPMLSARYTTDTQVELRRRRWGQPFPAWVQGIDFSAIASSVLLPDPPNLIEDTDGYTLAPGQTLTVTFQVTVDTSLPIAVTDIINTVTVETDLQGPFVDETIDPVVRPAVVVEYNNADFTREDTTVSYTHEVVNTGDIADSYRLTLQSDQGWTVDLIDPDTGGIIARDSNGDGVWDGGVTVNTGTLAPGERAEYRVRVTVPPGATGMQDHTRLTAVSNRTALVSDTAEDETTVLGPTDFGPVAIIPDNSGVVEAGTWTAYAHRVVNRTGATDTFDLIADSSYNEIDSNWTATIYHDSNGDGVYSPGIDVAISNTLQLADGATQLVFVVVDAPLGTPAGTVDVTHLTAISRNDTTLFDGATDTTTVVVTGLDLSGGGTRIVDPGDTGVFAGTLVNLGSSGDTYDLDITYSSLSGADGLNHPTQLAIDTNADDVPDLVIAEDTDGDGTWDTILAGYDTNTNGEPDVMVAGGQTLAYELRRTVDPAQTIHREHVTLTATSLSGRHDSITATNLLAAVTRAGIRGVRVDPEGEVAFVTTTQVGTASFMVYETNDPRGARGRRALHDSPVRSPVPDSLTPILYRVSTRPVTKRFVMIQETETDGEVLWKGPFRVGDRRMRRSFEDVERLMARAGIPHDRVQRTRGMRPLELAADPAHRPVLKSHRRRSAAPWRARRGPSSSRPRGGGRGGGGGGAPRYATSGVKIEVHEPGRVEVPAADLEAAGLAPLRPGVPVYLTNRGRLVRFRWVPGSDQSYGLVFMAEGLSTDYSGANVYVVTVGAPPAGGPVTLTDSSKPETPGFTRVEKNVLYVPSLPDGPDPWQWDALFSGWPWPDPTWDPTAGDFDLPDLLPGASGDVPVRIQVVGYTEHRHSLSATINGLPVGTLDFDGRIEATLEGTVSAETLLASGNTLSITYIGSDLPSSPGGDAMAYIDFVDLAIPRGSGSRTAVFDLVPYQSDLPSLVDVEYLIVTHPLFRVQANRVAELKADDGLKAVVVETETAYDRFSGGIVEPRAIQALVRAASRASAALRYVLLVGDDTFDPRDFVGIGSRSFVPSLFGRDATWGRVPSETGYSDVDGDGRPDLRFGRLPVQSIAEAEALVEKIATQAQGLRIHQGAQLVVVDNSSETDAPFRALAEEALALLPPSPNVRWAEVDHGPNAARVALLEGWTAGALLTHYFGHAGLTEWADERILTHADIDAHGSTWKPTVLFTWACLSQWHIGIFGTALNEALLLQPGGGPVASFGPAGITSPARQAILIDALYRELGEPGVSLGEAIRRAKRATAERDPKASETVEGFLLLGDPALVLPWLEAVPQ